jgi:hypothetical protein
VIWWPCPIQTENGSVVWNPIQQGPVDPVCVPDGPWDQDVVSTDPLGVTDE